MAREAFDAAMPGPHQHAVLREDVQVTREDLLRAPLGSVTRAGFDSNVEVCVRYLAAWLDGNGCVPIHWLMEDAATAEIARVQLWQWLHHAEGSDGREPLHLDDGTAIDFALFERALIGLPGKFGERMQMPGATRIDEAIALLEELTHRDTLEEFVTLPLYDRID